MRKPSAIIGSTVFFVAAPGVIAGLVPWILTGWHKGSLPIWRPFMPIGALLVAAGAIVLAHAFIRFVTEGSGTPAPIAPTEQLVVGGAYRYVRNPMYLAVLAVIFGQALILRQSILFYYGIAVFAAVFAFVRGYEEPTLSRRFGVEYEAYRRAVPGWLPLLRLWRSPGLGDRGTGGRKD
jgi:protein-S-isoprenylcysteine O-methyltransferase Ste14